MKSFLCFSAITLAKKENTSLIVTTFIIYSADSSFFKCLDGLLDLFDFVPDSY